MNASSARRTAYLREMGVGPVWKLRDAERPAIVEPSGSPDAATPAEAPMLTWGELEASVAACNNCGLCDGRQRVVFGAGDRSADWLFVGEGPGYHEDQQGEPFVGRSGHLLGAMMRAMGLERGKNTYITNVLKCRATDASGKDRPPTVEEAAACMPHLRNQMALIQPHIIVALGRPAAVNLLGAAPDATLASLRGKVHHIDIAGRQVGLIATYHPSYLLRTPAAKRQAWADLCMALRYKAETPARTA